MASAAAATYTFNDDDDTCIPKILHQIWIGDASKAPRAWMRTWEARHSRGEGWEYRFWNETRLVEEGIQFRCQRQIDAIPEINGKADIIRWELLERFGGVFVDADSICLRPLDPEMFLTPRALQHCGGFAAFENENIRQGLLATGTMGFCPGHPLVRAIVDRIASGALDLEIATMRAWYSVGPALLTRMVQETAAAAATTTTIHVFPSYYFLPTHFMGPIYMGHGAVFAYQEWSTAKSNYGDFRVTHTAVEDYLRTAAPELAEPPTSQTVSVNMVVHETPQDMLRQSLESIRAQVGHFGIEVVVVTHACSTTYLQTVFVPEWERIQRKTRFCRWIWRTCDEEGMALSDARQRALLASTSEWVFVLDSDDVMLPTRIAAQFDAILRTNGGGTKPGGGGERLVWMGANAFLFDHATGTLQGQSRLPERVPGLPLLSSIEEKELRLWIEKLPLWMSNHSSIAFRRQDAIDVGGYWPGQHYGEDYSLLVRLLLLPLASSTSSSLTASSVVGMNLPNVLVRHRLHTAQTHRRFTETERQALVSQIQSEIIQHYQLHLLD